MILFFDLDQHSETFTVRRPLLTVFIELFPGFRCVALYMPITLDSPFNTLLVISDLYLIPIAIHSS